ncbi:uncharacterized protein [Parasteatoda tepidariorum]|uniref:uncharacterized protein isoform X1 n=2 Tax=Parasteatoda tepidariorum TaxID=114398 RepID=UPI001C724B8D|nr:uncharacterized protein LOC107438488 isoform X1 [Parasteatoda tepidariorum]
MKMPWEIQVVTSVTLLAFLQGQRVSGVSQESTYVIECIRDMIPTQVYNECCHRENNCTIVRQQNRAIDCMSRIIMANYSSLFSDSREGGQGTTEMSHSYNRNSNNHQQWYDLLDNLVDACRKQPRARLQTCIRSELIKRCRYSMLQDRFTSYPGRWTSQRRTDYDSGYNDNYGRMDPRRRYPYMGSGRRGQDELMLVARPTNYGFNSDSRHYSRRDGGGGYDDADDEDFGYSSDSDSSFRIHP